MGRLQELVRWEQTEHEYLGGGGTGLGWMSLERRRRDGKKGLEKGGFPGGAFGVVADIPPPLTEIKSKDAHK